MILDDILLNLKNGNSLKAYTCKNSSYSYKELYKFVCNIYNFILSNNTLKKTIVVYGHKEIYMKSTFLACSFAGITYVPIDESMPIDRINLMIKQINPDLIIGDLFISGYKNISQREIEKIMNYENYNDIEKIYMKPEKIYYIIFTSGSTGVPKGVKITYKNLDSCINWLKSITNAKEDIILNQANFSFDLSIADLYLSLISKSEHYILENENKADFFTMFEELKDSNATIAVMTPSFADLLLLDKSFNEELMPNLKTIIFCGEQLLNNTVKKIYERFKKLKIINMYGPTECAFAVTSIEIQRNMNLTNIPVGKVKDDCQIVIIDDKNNILKDENVGEILIIGNSVADGYVDKSKNDKFAKYNGKPAYLTGDLGYIKDDILYYKCRKDKQIKYKGYRIELTDIEKNLLDLDYIQKAIVIAKKDNNSKIIKIIAFVQLKENIEETTERIKQDLKKKIPEYMCPVIKIVDKIPLNQNGKSDEKKLLEEY